MLTMTPGTQSQVDDLLDARATVRQLERELLKRRLALRKSDAFIAVRECKDKLTAAAGRLESNLDELELRQGRLPFGDDAEAPAASNGQGDTITGTLSGRTVKRKAVTRPVAAKVGWSNTR